MDSGNGQVVSLQAWREKNGLGKSGGKTASLGEQSPPELEAEGEENGEAVVRPPPTTMFEYLPLHHLPSDLRRQVMAFGTTPEDIAALQAGQVLVMVVFPDALGPPIADANKKLLQPLVVAAAANTPAGMAALTRLRTCQVVARWRDKFGQNHHQTNWYVPAHQFTDTYQDAIPLARFKRDVNSIRTWALLVTCGQWGYEPLQLFQGVEVAWLTRYDRVNPKSVVAREVASRADKNKPVWLRFSVAAEKVP